jgi:DNA-binding NarL/FixJ family response regulator
MSEPTKNGLTPCATDSLGRELAQALQAQAEQGRGRDLVTRPGAALDRAELERVTQEARAALDEAVYAAALAAARALAVAEVLDEALAALEETGITPAPVVAATATVEMPADTGVLSPREREVLALVAEGRTNKSIAEALYVSPNTIKTHVASLLNKLHANTRVQLATIAARQGLA